MHWYNEYDANSSGTANRPFGGFQYIEQFEKTLGLLKETYKNVEFSEQNKKINGYASALVEKMRDGIELTIVDSTDTVKVPICPECGMQCDPSIPYCMECGASI